MRPSGTEPGDFVEFDYDLSEAERRQRIRDVLLNVLSDLEKEIGSELRISNDGNEGRRPHFLNAGGLSGRVVVSGHRR